MKEKLSVEQFDVTRAAVRKKMVPLVELFRKQMVTQAVREQRPWLALPYDHEMVDEITTRLVARAYHIDYMIIVGIGGSASGTLAIVDALRPLLTAQAPYVWCADSVDPDSVKQLLHTVRELLAGGNRIQLVVVSKSGTTLETQVLSSLLWDCCKDHVEQPTPIVVSQKGSQLAMHAEQQKWDLFEMPATLSGRFSICSPVTLVPLALLGIDIAALQRGAACALTQFAEGSVDMLDALSLYGAALEAGYAVWELSVESVHCTSYAFWLRQLIAESLGKQRSDGTRVGLVPSITTATQDFHSTLQLTLAGPRMIVTRFVRSIADVPSALTVPASPLLLDKRVAGRSIADVHQALCDAVRNEYVTERIPHEAVVLSSSDPERLAEQMHNDLLLIALLGMYLEIDAENQPAVERYKRTAHHVLAADSATKPLEA